MSSREFTEWRAYYGMEPFGEEMANWRAGMLASVVVNLLSDKKTKAKQPMDFMPQTERPAAATPEELLRKIEMLNASFGGDDMRQKS